MSFVSSPSPSFYQEWVKLLVIHSGILSSVQVFSHQQSKGSIGSRVIHKHSVHCTILQTDLKLTELTRNKLAHHNSLIHMVQPYLKEITNDDEDAPACTGGGERGWCGYWPEWTKASCHQWQQPYTPRAMAYTTGKYEANLWTCIYMTAHTMQYAWQASYDRESWS